MMWVICNWCERLEIAVSDLQLIWATCNWCERLEIALSDVQLMGATCNWCERFAIDVPLVGHRTKRTQYLSTWFINQICELLFRLCLVCWVECLTEVQLSLPWVPEAREGVGEERKGRGLWSHESLASLSRVAYANQSPKSLQTCFVVFARGAVNRGSEI
jgi:hypothetical protein